MAKTQPATFETTFAIYTAQGSPTDGGAGRVYKVKDQDGQLLALKLLKPETISTQRVRRFKNELYFCKNHQHANVIKVIDDGFVNVGGIKVPFYVMPYYGKTLRHLMADKLEPAAVLPLFTKILDGVEASHKLGVTHRDLKPENILFDPKEKALVVADFGIAEFLHEDLYTAVETKAAERLANFLYAAPEQRVRGMLVDSRADIFALGLILHEMFTGVVVHGTGYQKIDKVAPEFSYVDDLIERMLKNISAERPGTIEAIKLELIARGNEFVALQKLDALRNTVVPSLTLDDQILRDPIRLISAEYSDDQLALKLNQPINQKWANCFHSIGNYTSFYGSLGAPNSFSFRGDTAFIGVEGRLAQQIIDWFKGYLSTANADYRVALEREARARERAESERIKRELAKEEEKIKINKGLRI